METLNLILLDIILLGIDDFELMDYVCSTGIPVIFFTTKNPAADCVMGLRMGAEVLDVLELLARVDSVLHRHRKLQVNIQIGDFEINARQQKKATYESILRCQFDNLNQDYAMRQMLSKELASQNCSGLIQSPITANVS